MKRPVYKNNKGQVIVAGMSLMLVAGVMLFFVFNSSRAVNEKINLVNAADAAAYSGAQVAARQLNFIAYTNRAMIANEVAIGHMVSFQSEVGMVANTIGSGISGLGFLPYQIIIDGALSFLGTSRKQIMDTWSDGMGVLTGTYILATDATNSMYSEFQEQEYLALAASNGSAIDAAMQRVANEYDNHDGVSISVNNKDTLGDVRDNALAGSKIYNLATNALDNIELCTLVMFAKPGNTSAPRSEASQEDDHDKISKYCTNPARPNGLSPMHKSNVVDDAGALLSMLSKSTADTSSAEWISDRNKDYRIKLPLPRDVERKGSTSAVWDAGNPGDEGRINWVAGSDTIKSKGLLGDIVLRIRGEGSADASSMVVEAKNNTPSWLEGTISGLLSTFGVCESTDKCDDLKDEDYQGSHNYAFINPMQEGATIIAFLNQTGNCNDLIGRDNDTKAVLDDFSDDQRRFGSNCSADGPILQAFSTAEVYYQRPGCTDGCTGFGALNSTYNGKPNLYNPFWQARLSVPSLAE